MPTMSSIRVKPDHNVMGSRRLLTVLCLCASGTTALFASCRTAGAPFGEPVLNANHSSLYLSWATEHGPAAEQLNHNATQAAFQIFIQNAIDGSQVWTSGEVVSTEQGLTVPAAAGLEPDASYQWFARIAVYRQDSMPPLYADCPVITFDTAPAPGAFPGRAQWIGGGGQLRSARGLTLPEGAVVRRARAHVSGLGAFYFFVNGQRVGDHVMDPPQSVYSHRTYYTTFDVAAQLQPGANFLGLLLGNYKWGYTDIWCNMTASKGPNGCRAMVLRLDVTLKDGRRYSLDTSEPSDWEARQGPVEWDHFFHGETFNAQLDWDWDLNNTLQQQWAPAHAVAPIASYPVNMGDTETKAIGALEPATMPPLRVAAELPALSVTRVRPLDAQPGDGGAAYVYDFGHNIAGMVRLALPAGHGLPPGTALRIEIAEITEGAFNDTGGLCKLCPGCNGNCADPGDGAGVGAYHGSCAMVGSGATCNTYCTNPAKRGDGPADHALRDEPCWPHQSYGPHPHYDNASSRYIGDFNNANMTNVYIVRGDGAAETYTPFFAAGGFRFAQISGLPPTAFGGAAPPASLLVGLSVHSAVRSSGTISLPTTVAAVPGGTPNVLNAIHDATRASQLANLWSVPTDCPQRERRGWMGDAQASSDEAMLNFDMLTFYRKFLRDMADDQDRWRGDAADAGSLPDVVPYDGIGGHPGCLVWQVAYIVIARNSWKHYGEDALPFLREHWDGLLALSAYFDRHADPASGLNEQQCYGDWMGHNPEGLNHGGSPLTPQEATSAFYHVLSRKYMAELAQALGRPAAETAKWHTAYAAGQRAYHSRFYDATAGGYSPCVGDVPPGPLPHKTPNATCHGTSSRGSQCSNAMALALGAPPTAGIAASVARALRDDVVAFGNKTTGGVVGIAWLFPALDEAGFSDTALQVLRGDAYPSIGFMMAQNMTTLCENYACTAHDAGGGSQNHIMLGAFDAWIAAALGGLDSAVNGTTGGWRHVVARVAPAAITVLGRGGAAHDTRLGHVGLGWAWDASTAELHMNLTLPVGATAEVHSPLALRDSMLGRAYRLQAVYRSGRQVWHAETAVATYTANAAEALATAAVVHQVGSGTSFLHSKYELV